MYYASAEDDGRFVMLNSIKGSGYRNTKYNVRPDISIN